MKLNKTIGRVATTLVATAMLASLAAPAYAAEAALVTTTNTVSFTKAITKDEAAGVPTGQFVFTVTDGTGSVSTQITDEDSNTENGVQIVANNTGATVAVDISFKMAGFDAPGTYSYTLQETSTDIPGMTVDNTKYTLNVVVVNADSENPDGKTFVINSAELSAGEGKTDTITDTYTTYSLTLDKTLKGDFADKNDSFVFDITFNANDTHATSFKLGNETVNFVDGVATQQVTLKGGESIVADGLPVGTTYTITESTEQGDAAKYETTASGTGVNDFTEASKQVTGDVKVPGAGDGAPEVASDVEVHYFNTLTSTPATGIVMDVAPYALLVVIAAAGCFVFLRKRRED